jgi:hypothetical protein
MNGPVTQSAARDGTCNSQQFVNPNATPRIRSISPLANHTGHDPECLEQAEIFVDEYSNKGVKVVKAATKAWQSIKSPQS